MAKKEIKSTLHEYFDESVASAVCPVMAANKAFCLSENGKTIFVGMMLDTKEIGYINNKTKNNMHVGGIIQAVKGGNIDIYVTPETLDNGELLFVPTAKTIDTLTDYSLFTNCNKYEFVKLNHNLDIIERTGVYASYNDFREISAGTMLLDAFLKKSESTIEEPSYTQMDVEEKSIKENIRQAMDGAKNVASEIKSKAADVVQNVVEKVADTSGYNDMRESPVETTSVQTSETQSVAENKVVENEETVIEETEDIVYTEIQVESSISRVFHCNNLELEVSSEPFDQLFTLNNHLIAFATDARDTYVNEQLNIMANEANRDLQKFRSENLQRLRQKYFALMSTSINDIQKELDIDNVQSTYGSKKFAIDTSKNKQLSDINSKIVEQTKLIDDEYNKDKDAFCQTALQVASVEYDKDHKDAYLQKRARLEDTLKSDIIADYNRELNDLYIARRNEAYILLDMYISATLDVLAEEYKTMIEDENALYNQKASEMREYAKELHAQDAKRLAVEEERNRISNEVNDARAEATAKIELIKKEYETAQIALEAKSKANIERVENQCAMAKEQMEERTRLYEEDRERLQHQLNDAIEKATSVQELVKSEYEHRISQANDDRDSWKQTLDTYQAQHKRNNILASVLVVAITIAALAGGFVAGGVYWNRLISNDASYSQVQSVTDEMQYSETVSDENMSET